MDHNVVIKVTGFAGVGKTTISLIIEEALQNYGIPVTLIDQDGEEYLKKIRSENRQDMRVVSLKERGLSATIIQSMALRGKP